jgi:hypothetical protein
LSGAAYVALAAASSARALGAAEAVALWIVFNVIIALLPLALSPWLASAFDANVRYDWRLLRDGELFFFSSALVAAAMGKMVELDARGDAPIHVLTFLALCLILLSSAMCFGAAVAGKSAREGRKGRGKRGGARNGAPPSGEKLAKASVLAAVGAVLCAFYAFYQGGFR